MDLFPVGVSTARAARAGRWALIAGHAFVWLAFAAGNCSAADSASSGTTSAAPSAPSMPDDAPAWTPAVPSSPAPAKALSASAPADKPKSGTSDKTVSGVQPASTSEPAKMPDAAAPGSAPPANTTPPSPTPANTPPAGTPPSTSPTPSPPGTNPLSPEGQPQYFQKEDLIAVQVRAAGIAGQGPVQDLSILPIEMFPFFLMDRQLYFGDLRFFPTVDGTFGGNVGFGYRLYSPSWDRVVGISGWYDADGTRDNYLQQVGVSLETYGKWFDFRTNIYVPVGQTDQQTSLSAVANSSQFVGSHVVYDQMQGYIAAMTGVDFEAGIPIPGKFAEDHNLRIYGGWYYFVDDRGDHIAGGSARIQANIYQGIDASVQVTNDNFFDTRAFVGVSWTFGPLHRSESADTTQQARLGEHVTRNYTVLAPTRSQVDPNVVAIDPLTGSPYTFAHVNSAAAPGGNGTINSPFQTIAAAQATDATIVFVHANSIFHGADATVVLQSGQALLGDGGGLQHTLAVNGIGTITLPHASNSSSLPVLDSATGNAITLAPSVIVSGFTITNPVGNGIFGNGISSSVVQNVSIDHAGNDGIVLTNSTGSVSIANATITNSVGNGLALDGGTANITFAGRVSGSQGYDLVVADTGSGQIDLTGLQLPGSGSQGKRLFNNVGNVSFNNLGAQLSGTRHRHRRRIGPGSISGHDDGFGGVRGIGQYSESPLDRQCELRQPVDRSPAGPGIGNQSIQRNGCRQRHHDDHKRGRLELAGHPDRQSTGNATFTGAGTCPMPRRTPVSSCRTILA